MSRPSPVALAATRASCCAVDRAGCDAKHRGGGAHGVRDPGCPAVDDSGHDNQPAGRQRGVVRGVEHGDPQAVRARASPGPRRTPPAAPPRPWRPAGSRAPAWRECPAGRRTPPAGARARVPCGRRPGTRRRPRRLSPRGEVGVPPARAAACPAATRRRPRARRRRGAWSSQRPWRDGRRGPRPRPARRWSQRSRRVLAAAGPASRGQGRDQADDQAEQHPSAGRVEKPPEQRGARGAGGGQEHLGPVPGRRSGRSAARRRRRSCARRHWPCRWPGPGCWPGPRRP